MIPTLELSQFRGAVEAGRMENYRRLDYKETGLQGDWTTRRLDYIYIIYTVGVKKAPFPFCSRSVPFRSVPFRSVPFYNG